MKKTKPIADKKKSDGSLLQAPKGTRDLYDLTAYHFQGFAEKAAEIATYYGFKPIETPILEHLELFSKAEGDTSDIVSKEMYSLRTKGGDHLAMRPEFTPSIMRAYFELGLQSEPQPILVYAYGPVFRHDKPQRGRYREFRQFELDVLGTSKPVADALIIKLLMLILEEVNLTDLRLAINSLGDKDCRQNYRRELVNYYKKHLKDVCPDCRERFKHNPLRLLDCKKPECQPIKQGAPSAITYLCHDCQKHFKEVLEYLEMMKINYEIDNTLVRGLDYYSRTVFEIMEPIPADAEPGTQALSITGGGRYDYLAKTLGAKKDVPAVGAAISVDRLALSPNYKPLNPRILKKPKFFFIQLSFDAKLKSFAVIEILRKARAPVAQSISKDSLAVQLALAEKSGAPYTIILGQKEAMEGTVIVRNMQNRSQETVPVADLAEYIKKC